MKKKILSIALLVMSLGTFTGIAQTANNNNSVKTENVRGERADKKGQRPQVNPYEGLKLTDAQKTKLQQLDTKRQEARQQEMQKKQEKKQQDKTARMEARKASKKQYLEEVKAIVGPEQYVVFLENMYINGGGHKDKAMKQAKHKDKKGMARNKSGKKDQKRNGQGRPGMRGNNQQNSNTAKS